MKFYFKKRDSKKGNGRFIAGKNICIDTDAINAILNDISHISATLQLADFLCQVAQVIHNHAEIYFLGFFDVATDGQLLVFRGGSAGEYTKVFLQRGFKRPLTHNLWLYRVVYAHEILQVGFEGRRMLIYSLPTACTESLEVVFKGDEGPFPWGAPLFPDTRWELFLPLRFEDNVKGVFWIHRNTDLEFFLEDIIQFQLLADQISRYLYGMVFS